MAAAAVPVMAGVASGPVGWAIVGGAALVGGGIWLASEVKKNGGRSPFPPGIRSDNSSRKEAYEKARQRGGGKEPRGPEKHGNGKPHFHPGDGRKDHQHDHFNFPKGMF
ncbi:hypothetical protein BLNAU_22248 [Blattamonas nauphoetae]|uniref:Uncharacterized protein n=1 Tax=Blattamonas nauphoetae TaxID=2049346 RepID=A0ABQ9WUL1_9EUKA|nr:hypothetical protein BLNAU_22244 [Blattamonas nauphoetae]KAK2942834.1 hypothetical protein BLNAU_22248 [Blattamonas nauphoetae]